MPIPKPRHAMSRQAANAQNNCVRPKLLVNFRQCSRGIFGNEGNDFHSRGGGNIERRTSNSKLRTHPNDISAFDVLRSMFDVKILFIPSPESPPHFAPAPARA